MGSRLRHHALHARIDQRGLQGPARRGDPGGHRRAGVFAELALGDHSAGGRAGGHHRHVRGHGGVRLQPEQPDAVRPGAGDRHRGRRRHRGGRSGGASHRARLAAARGHDSGDGAGLRPGDRGRPGAQRRVRAVRVHQRHHGAILPAVRADDFGVDDHFGVQLADAQPGAGGTVAAAARANIRRRRCRGRHLRLPEVGSAWVLLTPRVEAWLQPQGCDARRVAIRGRRCRRMRPERWSVGR